MHLLKFSFLVIGRAGFLKLSLIFLDSFQVSFFLVLYFYSHYVMLIFIIIVKRLDIVNYVNRSKEMNYYYYYY